MRMRIILLVAVLSASLWLLGCASKGHDSKDNMPHVSWLSYHSALVTGKSESKPILMHFAPDWNEGSQRMQRETYSDYEIAGYLKANFATGWVDTEQQAGLAKKYNISSLPTVWFVDAEGKNLTSVNGFIGPRRMMLLLEFIQTKAYDQMSFEAWKDRRPGH